MKHILAAMAVIAAATGFSTARAANPPAIAFPDNSAHAPNFWDAAAGREERRSMRVSSIRAGDSAAEVEQVLGRPTIASRFDDSSGDNRVLVYTSEPVRTSVTVTLGRVTEVRLDLISIDKSLLPACARTILPLMTRGGLLSLLGSPSETVRWIASDLEIEQMVFARPDERVFSVFLAGGNVVDVKPGSDRPTDIGRLILPATIPDTSAGTDLRIGMTPTAAAAAVGHQVRTATFSFKSQQVVYSDNATRDGHDLVSLTFTGGVLTAFSFWPSAVAGATHDTAALSDTE